MQFWRWNTTTVMSSSPIVDWWCLKTAHLQTLHFCYTMKIQLLAAPTLYYETSPPVLFLPTVLTVYTLKTVYTFLRNAKVKTTSACVKHHVEQVPVELWKALTRCSWYMLLQNSVGSFLLLLGSFGLDAPTNVPCFPIYIDREAMNAVSHCI